MAFSSTTVSVGDPTEKADYDRLMDNTIYLKDGATEFTGEKTFKSATVFQAGVVLSSTINVGGAATFKGSVHLSSTVEVDGRQTFNTAPDWRTPGALSSIKDYSGETGGIAVRRKIVAIGNWDMDASGSVDVLHEIATGDIKSVDVVIINDLGVHSKLAKYTAAGLIDGGIGTFDNTKIELHRRSSGVFDSGFYDSTSFNRGWIVFDYTDF